MRSLAPWVAGALTAGVLAAPMCPPFADLAVWLLPLAWMAALAATLGQSRVWAFLALGANCATCAFAGVVLSQQAHDVALHPSLRAALDRRFGSFSIELIEMPAGVEPVPTRLTLREDAVRRDDVVLLRARVSGLRIAGSWRAVDGGVLVTVAGRVAEGARRRWHAGAELEAPVTFRRPARYLNDGVPDAEVARALAGVTLTGSVKSGLLVERLGAGSALARVSAAARERIRVAVAGTVGRHDTTAAAVVTAVLIGDDSGLTPELRERWQAAGTYHVVAISGGNIAVLVALAVSAAALAGCGPRGRAIFGLAVLAVFALVVIPGSSVHRAALMAALHLFARAIDHRTGAWQSLAVALAAMIAVDPLGFGDVGLLLTFGATVALIECGGLLGRAPARGLSWLVAAVVATACVELVVLPIQVWWFSRLTLAGLVLNLVAVPLMSLAQVAGLAAVTLDLLGVAASPPAWGAAHAVSLLDRSMALVAWVPWLGGMAPRPPLTVVTVYYLSLVAWWSWSGPVRWVVAPPLAGSALAIVAGWPMPASAALPARHVELTMIDVGQGESMLLRSGGWSALVDTGGRPFGDGTDIGRRVVAPALWARGVRALNALLVTHPDPDHVGGAVAVLEALPARELWLGIDVPGHEPSAALRARAGLGGVRVAERRAGDRLRGGAVRVRVLHPPAPDWERRRVRNDDSVVLEVRHGDVAMLLLGDVGADVEQAILPRLLPARLRVLKVGHHGSRTSTSQALLDAWRPDVALISAGRGNSFGHPAPVVLERLRSAGAAVFRTDADGQITVRSDGRQLWVASFRGRRTWMRPAA